MLSSFWRRKFKTSLLCYSKKVEIGKKATFDQVFSVMSNRDRPKMYNRAGQLASRDPHMALVRVTSTSCVIFDKKNNTYRFYKSS